MADVVATGAAAAQPVATEPIADAEVTSVVADVPAGKASGVGGAAPMTDVVATGAADAQPAVPESMNVVATCVVADAAAGNGSEAGGAAPMNSVVARSQAAAQPAAEPMVDVVATGVAEREAIARPQQEPVCSDSRPALPKGRYEKKGKVIEMRRIGDASWRRFKNREMRRRLSASARTRSRSSSTTDRRRTSTYECSRHDASQPALSPSPRRRR